MAKTARAAIEDLLTCERCHAFYYVERGDDGARTRLRCTSCGHSRDVLLSGAKSNKWTLIDPDGDVMTFAAWEDLVRATPGSGVTAVRAKSADERELDEGRKSLSGSALLDITPTPVAPKLALIDSSPQLPAAPDEDPHVNSMVESLEAAPAAPAAAVAPVAAKQADKADKKEGSWDEDEAEVLSMRDLQVVPEVASSPMATPAAPPAGKLRTLPPARDDAPPPPTITVEAAPKPKASDPPAAKEEPKKEAKAPKNKKEPKEKEADDEKDTSRSRTTTRPPAKSTSSASSAAKAAQEEEDGGRGWVLPAIGVAVAAGVVWWIASSPPAPNGTGTAETTAPTAVAPESTATPEPTATATASATATATTEIAADPATPTTEKAASAEVVKDAPKPAETATTTTTATSTTAEPKKQAAPATSLADALDKAGAAKRAGNYAAARELYGRVLRDSPSNVEANAGLGDIARAQSDFASAKASYQAALASSPNYGPAMLGLADTLWDMGDRAGAQTQYAAIVRARGANAPERAVTRSSGN